MIRIYSAATLPDAHLVRGLLGQAGIDATVFNENLQGGLGEIPFTHAYPEVWIVDERDLRRAREVIRQIERPAGSSRPVICPSCQEDNPGNFQVCWNCGGAL
jgi:putative signal transducing protein